MFCWSCGKEIADNSVYCSECGEKQIKNVKNKKKSFKTPIILIAIFSIVFYFLLICPLKCSYNFLGFQVDIILKYEPLKCRMIVGLGALKYNIDNISWLKAISIRYNLLTGKSPQFDEPKQIENKINKDNILNNANIHYAKFKKTQKEYSLNFWKMEENKKEEAFKKVYDDYLSKFSNFETYFANNGGYDLTYEYFESHKEDFKKLGINFISLEGSYEPIPDYTSLIKTFGIPKNWEKWLELQEKYTLQRLYACNDSVCEGESLSIEEIKQAIIDLDEIEKKSKTIASIKAENYDYIPDTSARFLNNYLIGNDLNWLFDYDRTNKIYDSVKESYEDFIKNNKDSKYYGLINKYYDKLKKNNFRYSDKNKDWLYEQLEKF